MNTTDKIVTALTPGSIFNRNGLIFRSLGSLASFTELEEDEVLALLNGDLAELVTCKPSTKGKGILVALTAQIPVEEDGPIAVVAAPVAPGLPDPPGPPAADAALVQDLEEGPDAEDPDAPLEHLPEEEV